MRLTTNKVEQVLKLAREIDEIERDALAKSAPLREQLAALLNRSGPKAPSKKRAPLRGAGDLDRATVHAAACILTVLGTSVAKSSSDLVKLTELPRRDIMAALGMLVRDGKVVSMKNMKTNSVTYRRK